MKIQWQVNGARRRSLEADRRAVSQRAVEGVVDINNPLSEAVQRETVEDWNARR